MKNPPDFHNHTTYSSSIDGRRKISADVLNTKIRALVFERHLSASNSESFNVHKKKSRSKNKRKITLDKYSKEVMDLLMQVIDREDESCALLIDCDREIRRRISSDHLSIKQRTQGWERPKTVFIV